MNTLLLAVILAGLSTSTTRPPLPASRLSLPDSTSRPALMPWPQSITWNSGALRLDSSFTVTVSGRTDQRLERALDRAIERLGRRTGITFL
ncbi:MAG: hypothetical protein ACREL4_07065, partial [Gemmatimonadales bacterium]